MAKPRLLLVEDDRDIAKILRYNLEKEGYDVVVAADGESGVASFRRERPRLVILDLMLPKVDGLEVCRLIRAEDRRVPVLMLTAKGTEVDKVVGLEMGADDYVTKPFSLREVLSRVKALLRRSSLDTEAPADALVAGALELHPERFEVRLNKKRVELTHKEFELLKALWTARGKVLGREEILERVWGLERSTDIDTRTVDQHLARLRAKLGAEEKRLRTVKGVGYQFLDV